jgi:RimJ/RimL family protein N-acetyltransferase
MKIIITNLVEQDIDQITAAFRAIGWNKPRNLYETYLLEQTDDVRSVLVAKINSVFAGYITLKWCSAYSNFKEDNIPEIVDLNVLPPFRNQGIGTLLITKCESLVRARNFKSLGIGFGMTKDYANAQRLYIKLGYIPDGNGLAFQNQSLVYGDQVIIDDDLIFYLIKSLHDESEQLEINLPSYITTPRLLLRAPKIGDEDKLNLAILESFEILNQYMAWAKARPSLEESREVVTREARAWVINQSQNAELMLLIFDKETNDLIGATGFHNIKWEIPCAETGYWVRKKYSGKGYITEAANAITRYAFEVLKLKRLAITCNVDNKKSKKIPERLHYNLEAILKCNEVKPNTQETSDTLVYARTNLFDLPQLSVKWSYQKPTNF